MALLASCWLIIEYCVIPYGLFLKWLCLSFYIHPVFLGFCQIFLWLRLFLVLFHFPCRVVWYLILCIFRLPRRAVILLLSFIRPIRDEVFYDAIVEPEIPQDCRVLVWTCSEIKFLDCCEKFEAAEVSDCVKESWLNEYLYSDHYTSCLLAYDLAMSESLLSDTISSSEELMEPDEAVEFKLPHELEDPEISLDSMQTLSQESSNLDISSFDVDSSSSATDSLVDHECLPPVCSSSSPVGALEQQQIISTDVHEDLIDPFHHKYTERMRFFDALYHERSHGLNTILASPGLFKNAESSMARKRLLRSLECDLELIYVAQSCLSWEALNHQYQKVEALTSSDNSENRLFHHSIPEKFQEFQVLLERFVEEQKSEGQRHSNLDTHKRLSLQVPDVTGFIGGEGIRATQVLKAIEECIKAFWFYVRTDNKKSLWKLKGFVQTHSPVEDPKDLELLYSVTKDLHKKGIMLKDLQGKKRCWLRRKVEPLRAEHEKLHLISAMIDMKLVQRLLKMSLISTSQLNWCQEKLNNLEFRQGKVCRGCTSHLFPCS